MFYEYYYGGMHFIWWLLWASLLFWMCGVLYNIPGQRKKKDSPLELLQKRFSSGDISRKEYQEKKAILQNSLR